MKTIQDKYTWREKNASISSNKNEVYTSYFKVNITFLHIEVISIYSMQNKVFPDYQSSPILCLSFYSNTHFCSSVFTHHFINVTDDLCASYFKRPPHFHSNILYLITMGTTVFLSFRNIMF